MKKTTIYLSEAEWRLVIRALNEMRTEYIAQSRSVSFLDEVMLKIMNAPTKRVKIA